MSLLGISVLGGKKRAVLAAAKPNGGWINISFEEGKKEHGVEVKKIDASKGVVEVKIEGEKVALKFNGPKKK